MAYIKKLIMKGLKSFAHETEIPFSEGMNIIVGPNGSGKSNITDAICFVLGRMSIKSMRANKAANLIFAGTKNHKPAKEASVKLIFDNSDKKFPIDKKEFSIERIVRKNGQSIYKIDEDKKTRQEVVDLLAHAGLDPYGFNIVLQGEIDEIVKMNTVEKREVIEEVAGISVYEDRKKDSLRELDKTDEKLKEVNTTLRERRSYLKNLENERKQALKYNKYKERVKRYKASIIKKKQKEKNKKLEEVEKKLEEEGKNKEDLKEKIQGIDEQINNLEEDIGKINSSIEGSTSRKQEDLNQEISNLRAEIKGLEVRKESDEAKKQEIIDEKNQKKKNIEKLKSEIEELRKEAPNQARKQKQLEEKKQELDAVEEEKKRFYNLKQKLSNIKEKLESRKNDLVKNKNENDFLMDEIEKTSQELDYYDIKECEKSISNFEEKAKKKKEETDNLQEEIEQDKETLSVSKSEILRLEEVKEKVQELDICPLCKNKVTEEHQEKVISDCDTKIGEFRKKIEDIEKKENGNKSESLKKEIDDLHNKKSKAEIDMINLRNVEDRKNQMKRLENERDSINQDIQKLENEKEKSGKKIRDLREIEESYDKLFLEVQEISGRTKETVNTELESKEKDLEKLKIDIKQGEREKEEIGEKIGDYSKELEDKKGELEQLEEEYKELENKFQGLVDRKNNLQKEIHDQKGERLEIENKINQINNNLNNFKIDKARLDAEIESLESDFEPYQGVKITDQPIHTIENKLSDTKAKLENMGPVNLKSLEVYDSVKKEYDEIAEKSEILREEKEEILKIIDEIDRKKKRTFKKTLKAINKLFNRNFSRLSNKGEVYLAPEDEENIFEAGLEILVKVGRGKYFDVNSLSGGERTLVALSLIFAIQEHNPYCFYIFDEVDAPLDKRNSEKLTALIKKYMKTGQYIVVTHNDALISESSMLYGVSMQDGVSKIISMEV